MIDLIFFSTNRTKLTHFRYLGSKLGVTVRSFKEVNYYASYREPRIHDRAKLLQLSYESALDQWRRRQGRFEDDSTTFFFEDTSVKIEALSTHAEVPGVDVKYWMRETTFAKLDAELKDRGNNRRASVRSDIVVHLPRRWKEVLGVSGDYLWVHGEVSGSIAEQEEDLDLNLVFPWLDNKSFNRWFVPNGAQSPISAMEIDEADKYDFRRIAFSKVHDLLSRLKLTDRREPISDLQLELPKVPPLSSILLVCGPSCAGKTTLASWMTDSYGIPHIEASDFMYRAFWDRHGLSSTTKIGDFAEAALRAQPDIVSSQVASHFKSRQYRSAVVTGFRAPAEITLFRQALPAGVNAEVLFVTSHPELRLARALKRNRDGITPEKFEKREKQEQLMGVMDIAGLPGVASIANEGEQSELFTEVARRYAPFTEAHMFRMHRAKYGSPLEPLILATLADLHQTDTWLTTTEITAALNRKFGVKKFKDNVSRYFNQGYHAFYDVRLRTREDGKAGPHEYLLSTTGVSEAKILERSGGASPAVRQTPAKITAQLELPLDGLDRSL